MGHPQQVTRGFKRVDDESWHKVPCIRIITL